MLNGSKVFPEMQVSTLRTIHTSRHQYIILPESNWKRHWIPKIFEGDIPDILKVAEKWSKDFEL